MLITMLSDYTFKNKAFQRNVEYEVTDDTAAALFAAGVARVATQADYNQNTFARIDPSTGAVLDGFGNPVASHQNVGLSSGMTAVEITTSIQRALDGGNKRVVVSGNGVFTLSDRLYVDDNTTLVIEQGCTLVGPASLYYPDKMMGLIVNRQILAPRSNVTITSSGTTCTIGWTSHGKSVGSPIMLLGSVSQGYNGVYRVASVVDQNTLTVQLEEVPSVTTPTAVSWGSLQACSANENIVITVNGELNGNGANQPAPGVAPTDRYLGGVFLSGVIDSKVNGSGRIKDCKGYAVLIAGSHYSSVDGLKINSIYRDGAHFQGPGKHLRISNLSGYTYDDFTSLTTGDLQSLELTEGEFEDVVIENCVSESGTVGNACAQFGKSVWWFSDIRYKNIRHVGDNSVIHIKGGGTPAQYTLDKVVYTGELKCEDISFENKNQTSSAAAVFMVTGCDPTLKQVTINGCSITGVGVTNFGRFVSLARQSADWSIETLILSGANSSRQGSASAFVVGAAGITIGKFLIENCAAYIADNKEFFSLSGMTIPHLEVVNSPGRMGNNGTLLGLSSGTVDNVVLTRCSPTILTASTGSLVFSNGAAIRTITFNDCNFSGAQLLWGETSMNTTNGHKVRFSNCTITNGNKLVRLNKGITIEAMNQIEIGASQSVYDLRGAFTYTVNESNIDSERTTPFGFSGGATVNVYSQYRKVDVTTAGINRVEGGALWNTNAAAGTLGTAGPVVCLGTAANSWKRVGNYALTY